MNPRYKRGQWWALPLVRFRHWLARWECDRVGHDMESGTYRGEYQTAYWWSCKRCGEGDRSE